MSTPTPFEFISRNYNLFSKFGTMPTIKATLETSCEKGFIYNRKCQILAAVEVEVKKQAQPDHEDTSELKIKMITDAENKLDQEHAKITKQAENIDQAIKEKRDELSSLTMMISHVKSELAELNTIKELQSLINYKKDMFSEWAERIMQGDNILFDDFVVETEVQEDEPIKQEKQTSTTFADIAANKVTVQSPSWSQQRTIPNNPPLIPMPKLPAYEGRPAFDQHLNVRRQPQLLIEQTGIKTYPDGKIYSFQLPSTTQDCVIIAHPDTSSTIMVSKKAIRQQLSENFKKSFAPGTKITKCTSVILENGDSVYSAKVNGSTLEIIDPIFSDLDLISPDDELSITEVEEYFKNQAKLFLSSVYKIDPTSPKQLLKTYGYSDVIKEDTLFIKEIDSNSIRYSFFYYQNIMKALYTIDNSSIMNPNDVLTTGVNKLREVNVQLYRIGQVWQTNKIRIPIEETQMNVPAYWMSQIMKYDSITLSETASEITQLDQGPYEKFTFQTDILLNMPSEDVNPLELPTYTQTTIATNFEGRLLGLINNMSEIRKSMKRGGYTSYKLTFKNPKPNCLIDVLSPSVTLKLYKDPRSNDSYLSSRVTSVFSQLLSTRVEMILGALDVKEMESILKTSLRLDAHYALIINGKMIGEQEQRMCITIPYNGEIINMSGFINECEHREFLYLGFDQQLGYSLATKSILIPYSEQTQVAQGCLTTLELDGKSKIAIVDGIFARSVGQNYYMIEGKPNKLIESKYSNLVKMDYDDVRQFTAMLTMPDQLDQLSDFFMKTFITSADYHPFLSNPNNRHKFISSAIASQIEKNIVSAAIENNGVVIESSKITSSSIKTAADLQLWYNSQYQPCQTINEMEQLYSSLSFKGYKIPLTRGLYLNTGTGFRSSKTFDNRCGSSFDSFPCVQIARRSKQRNNSGPRDN